MLLDSPAKYDSGPPTQGDSGAYEYTVKPKSTRARCLLGCFDCFDVGFHCQSNGIPYNDFETCGGIEEVTAIIRDKQVDENLRVKCGEFLLLLIGHVDGRDMQPMATVHDDIRRLLGEKSASLIWAASQFGSTLDPEERLTALHIQARRVLESHDLFGV